jgi:hypothetical protein
LPMFLRQFERPSFTPIQTNRQNYSSVYRRKLKYVLIPYRIRFTSTAQ